MTQVSEILDSELLGEGLIPTLQQAHDMLLAKNPQTVPYRATTYGQVNVSCYVLPALCVEMIETFFNYALLPPSNTQWGLWTTVSFIFYQISSTKSCLLVTEEWQIVWYFPVLVCRTILHLTNRFTLFFVFDWSIWMVFLVVTPRQVWSGIPCFWLLLLRWYRCIFLEWLVKNHEFFLVLMSSEMWDTVELLVDRIHEILTWNS